MALFDFNAITNTIYVIRDLVWSSPLILLLITVGIYQTWQIKGLQFRFFRHLKIKHNAKKVNADKVLGDISAFQALMTALAGAIGTGNITGIAAAVATGGFGALFWMWVVAFFGMATAYSETLLAVKYRTTNAKGEIIGGPMVTLKNALCANNLAICFALFGSFAGIGYGMVQANSVIDAAISIGNFNRYYLGILLAALAGSVIIGGVKRIGRAASTLVPFMAIAYLCMSLIVIFIHGDKLFFAFKLIVTSAFSGQAAVGGFLGSTIMLAVQNGSQYGIFANEAGLGSFAIASSCAKTKEPVTQGFLAMSGVFIATMVICTITGLVLAITEVLGTTINGELLSGSPLAMAAFGSVHSSFPYLVLMCLILFAFTTILAWSYYGEKCFEFLLGIKCAHFYRWAYIVSLILGAAISRELVWAFAHIANGLMTIPNLISIIYLSNDIKNETQKYLAKQQSELLVIANGCGNQ